MAKKVVARIGKGGSKDFTKVIKMVKSPKTGAYTFKEEILPKEGIEEFIKKG